MGHSTSLPGFGAPAVGFEQPFEMLEACHERVNRTLDLLRRLMAHIDTNGHDTSSRSAAADVLRYFDIAAPLHHEDEEIHVFPALAGSTDATVRAAIATLQRDHERMATCWTSLRGALVQWSDDAAAPAIDDATRQAAGDFIGIYAAHIETEESLVYPAARRCFDAAGLARIGTEMQGRRGG
jgi:hemerythrin-like domain-containing protein